LCLGSALTEARGTLSLPAARRRGHPRDRGEKGCKPTHTHTHTHTRTLSLSVCLSHSVCLSLTHSHTQECRASVHAHATHSHLLGGAKNKDESVGGQVGGLARRGEQRLHRTLLDIVRRQGTGGPQSRCQPKYGGAAIARERSGGERGAHLRRHGRRAGARGSCAASMLREKPRRALCAAEWVRRCRWGRATENGDRCQRLAGRSAS